MIAIVKGTPTQMAPPIIEAKAESRFPSDQYSRPDMAVTPGAPRVPFGRRPRMNDQRGCRRGRFVCLWVLQICPNQPRQGEPVMVKKWLTVLVGAAAKPSSDDRVRFAVESRAVQAGPDQLSFDVAFTEGPPSVPGSAGMFAASCSETAKLYVLVAAEPTVPDRTAGPASVPAKAKIPAPELCALGTMTVELLVRASAGPVIASARAIAPMIFFIMPTSFCGFPIGRTTATIRRSGLSRI